MKWRFLCMVLSVAAASECGICMHGRCLGPNPLKIGSEDITGLPSAIDLENNVLYIVNNGLQAINLDDNTKKVIQTSRPNEKPVFFTVDQVTGEVYYSFDRTGYIRVYKYRPQSNQNNVVEKSTSKFIWAYNGTLYTAGLIKGVSTIIGSSKKSIDTLKSTKVKRITFDKLGNMYASTTNKVYKVKPNEVKKDLKLSSNVVKSDRNGNVYSIDTDNYVIHQIDLVTEQLSLVGAFGAKYHEYMHSFKFDKYSNIIAQFPNTRTYTYFKDTTDRCMISNQEDTLYKNLQRYVITNLNTMKVEDISTSTTKNIVQEIPKTVDSPHFGD